MGWNDFWTALTSVGTVAMAFTTLWVIRKNKQHHQDSFKPICVLVPEHGVDPGYGRAEIIKCQEVAANDSSHGTFEVHCALKNIGVGPALNVRMELRIRGFDGYGVSVTHSPLAKDESRGDKENPLLIPVTFRDDFNSSDFASATSSAWEIFIEYRDCFGNTFHTRHTQDPRKPWSTVSDGPVPKARAYTESDVIFPGSR
jgi:hypothetical protein